MAKRTSSTSAATTETVSLTVELPRDLVERLNALADRTTWDVADYVREALAGYIPWQEREIAAIQEAIDEADSGAPGIPHEKVMAWVESWGKPDELPFPG
jgi:predicted transcriptional regulator